MSHSDIMMKLSVYYVRKIHNHGNKRLMNYIGKPCSWNRQNSLPTTIFHIHQPQENTIMVLLLTQAKDGFSPFLTQITMAHATSTTNTNVVQTETVPINTYAECVKNHTLKPNVPNRQQPIKSINPIQNKIPSPVNPEVFARELQDYKKDLFQTNIDGFTYGFKLGMEGDKSHRTCHSLSRVVVPATLHNISVNAHFTRFL